jgi:hypothetical protein
VSLINDPRNTYDQIYTVERLGNVVGGVRDVRYINLEIDELKEIAIKLIQVSDSSEGQGIFDLVADMSSATLAGQHTSVVRLRCAALQ